ncbi:hypothetical protein SISNIDRAFT_467013 [Sistotremastrum niveocremeum HHB9708]|uniref:Exonuclease domain-containing protein n=1 Tax=Sistotremastrum niveocremeum HHB9708 TaxID=1314777 RepID=A0A164T888_9AGAM|nr:hypothetical protein SISNIDRAFT_467013 [Sistotremastrum niveocremeum HHB9708]
MASSPTSPGFAHEHASGSHNYDKKKMKMGDDVNSNSFSALSGHPGSGGSLEEGQVREDNGDDDEEGEGEWMQVDKRKEKKVKKQASKAVMNPPRFFYSSTEIKKRKEAITIPEIRDLVLNLVADAPAPTWLRIENPRSIQKVLILLIPGLTPSLLSLPTPTLSATESPFLPLPVPASTPSFPFISTFMHALPTIAPGESTKMHSVMNTFFSGPVSGEEKKRRILERISQERNMSSDPSQYCMTVEQMIENDYPVPSYLADVFTPPSDDWVQIPLAKYVGPKRAKIYALDCEMCETEDGRELTSICILDYSTAEVIYREFVKPSKPIIDYLTRFSGITAAHLESTTTTLFTVQQFLSSLLSPSSPSSSLEEGEEYADTPTPILLGHSLESDLRALRILHPRCIDTSVIFHHPRGPPLKPGLAWLTKKWLGREIQNRGEGGHDPEEDARACMDLLRRKVDGGVGFGTFKTDVESIFVRMGRSRSAGEGVKSAVVDHGNPSGWYGAKASTCVACKNDEDVVRGVEDMIGGHRFVWGRMVELADALGWTTSRDKDAPPPSTLTSTTIPHPNRTKETNPFTAGTTSTPPNPFSTSSSDPLITPSSTQAPISSSSASVPSPDLEAVISRTNAHLQKIYAALPSRTALILFTGHSDPRAMSELNARRGKFEREMRFGSLSNSNSQSRPNGNSEDGGGAGGRKVYEKDGGIGESRRPLKSSPSKLKAQNLNVDGGNGEESVRWTSEDGRKLEEETMKARKGLLFLALKP